MAVVSAGAGRRCRGASTNVDGGHNRTRAGPPSTFVDAPLHVYGCAGCQRTLTGCATCTCPDPRQRTLTVAVLPVQAGRVDVGVVCFLEGGDAARESVQLRINEEHAKGGEHGGEVPNRVGNGVEHVHAGSLARAGAPWGAVP